MKKEMPKKTSRWFLFSDKVSNHIQNYVIKQYGDDGEDPYAETDTLGMLKQVEKYIKRHGRNQREGQDKLDMIKAAHCIQMAYDRLCRDETDDMKDSVLGLGDK